MDSSIEFLVRAFERDRLYGTIEIKFENGQVVLLKKSETIKPALRGNREEHGHEK